MKSLTRREFSKLTFATIAAAAALPCVAQPPKPNSKIRGVQLGLNVPYSFSNPSMTGEDVLKNCVQLGFSAVELRTQPVETFLGAPKEIIFAKTRTPAQTEELANWRKSLPISESKKFRKMYEDAGV